MYLSIGMIVKNEEKYLRQCLEALKPLLEQVKSELIIIDTGSDDSTVEIAREFTDKVFHFDWCNDFAAARNAAMKRAKGIWYMSIDADEILVDTKELIAFFNSGEYKKFNSAAYMIKNMADTEHQVESSFQALRLVKITNDSYYINAVHEHFGHIYGPTKFLSVTAEHYGYLKIDNLDYIEFKMERNLKILFTELEKKPADLMIYLNICQTYRMMEDYQKALEYCEKGLEYAKKQDKDPSKYSLYSNIAGIHYILGDFLTVIDIADEYFLSRQTPIGTDLEFYFFKAESSFQLKRYKEAAVSFKDYLHFYSEFKQGLHNTFDTLQHSINFTSEASYRIAVLRLANSLLEEKDYAEAKSCLKLIPVADCISDSTCITYRIEIELCLMDKSHDYTGIADLDDNLDERVQKTFHRFINKKIMDVTERPLLLKEFAMLNNPKTNYQKLLKLQYQYYADLLTPQAVLEFISQMEEWKPEYADAIYFAVYTGLPLQSITSLIDTSDVENYFYNNSNFHFNDLANLVSKTYKYQTSPLNANTELWLSHIYLLGLISGNFSEEQAFDLFSNYSHAAFAAVTAQFKTEIQQDENADLLPEILQIGRICHKAVNALENGQNSNYVRYLNAALKQCPQLTHVIQILIGQFKNNLTEISKKTSEFEAYAIKVKESIRILISNEKFDEATQYIRTYESLCPHDKEIDEFKKCITSMHP